MTIQMTEDQMREVARGNIEQFLSCAIEEDGEDSVYDNAYCLGFDALIDKGVEVTEARRIAREVAQLFAQP